VTIEPAGLDDPPVIVAMRQEASDWLAKQGIDQWAAAWPTPQAQSAPILTSICAGETWMVRDDDTTTAATVTLDSWSDPRLWTPKEQQQSAMYLHRSSSAASTPVSVPTSSTGRAGEPGLSFGRYPVRSLA
jgi:hypothetical protein